jgi:hypothetical protein
MDESQRRHLGARGLVQITQCKDNGMAFNFGRAVRRVCPASLWARALFIVLLAISSALCIATVSVLIILRWQEHIWQLGRFFLFGYDNGVIQVTHDDASGNSHQVFHFNAWHVASASAFLPALFCSMAVWNWVNQSMRRRLERRRVERFCCRQCGYDMRATSDRCPECGCIRVVKE